MARKKKRASAQSPPSVSAPPKSAWYSRFNFFLSLSGFFAVAALLTRINEITVWPGAEAYALGHALSPDRGGYFPSFFYYLSLSTGAAERTEAIWFFPRLYSALALLGTGFFTFRYAGRLFGREATVLGLLAAAAGLYLPFFGKVATPDAWALLGHAGFFWTVLLSGTDKEKNYVLPAGLFLFLGGLAAPLSTVAFGAAAVIAARLVLGGSRRWLNLLALLALPLVVWLLQGNQGGRTYWFWGSQPLAYGRWLGLCLLGCAPFVGFLLAGLRDLVYKVKRGEQTSRLWAAGLGIGLVTQSLFFPLLLALVAGKQMQLYFREERYPWKDWVRGGATVQLIGAFIAAVVALSTSGIAFVGQNGFRAALGMAAAYWIFSLLGVLGLYGDKRDFALGGTVLSGVLAVLFFWVQVYPYFEARRAWPRRLVNRIEVPLPTYVDDDYAVSNALPYLRLAEVPVVADSTAADLRVVSWPVSDTLSAAGIEEAGWVIGRGRMFGVRSRR